MADVGHYFDAEGGSSFRVFAPLAGSLSVQWVDGGRHLPLVRDELGYWTGHCERLPHGSLYWLDLDGRRLPDPASRCQPQGVHGPSMVAEVLPALSPGWAGIAMADAILYELHLGTFTEAGTLAAAQHRLPYLAALGINAVELLPIAAFPGQRNWGYDGTFLFALQTSYGSYADLKAFIEAAHALGIAVVLDVVYNHFGPEGNYSGAFAPYTKAAATPWGAAINFDTEWNHGVREFFLENIRHWVQAVGFDGLRMDAVSLIFDNSPVHILREFTDTARAIGQAEGREVLTIAEHLRNNRFVTHAQGFNYHAQWNDDLNHAIELAPRRADALVLRATAYRYVDSLELAEEDLRRALALDPRSADALLERGIVRRLRNDMAGARADWLQVLRLAPEGGPADAARTNLEKLDVHTDR